MRMQGQVDTALDALGVWQAQQVAHALNDESIDAIVSSDLARAMQTALPLARQHGLRVQLEQALRERSFGVFQGFTYAHIERHWPDDSARWRARDPTFAPPGGESLEAFYARCRAVADRLVEGHAGRTVVWVTHGGVLDCLHRAAQGPAALARQHEGPQSSRAHHHGEGRPETDHLPCLDEQGQLRERQCDENKAKH